MEAYDGVQNRRGGPGLKRQGVGVFGEDLDVRVSVAQVKLGK